VETKKNEGKRFGGGVEGSWLGWFPDIPAVFVKNKEREDVGFRGSRVTCIGRWSAQAGRLKKGTA